jgi:hypothetical protein
MIELPVDRHRAGDEAERLAGPDDDFLGQPRQVQRGAAPRHQVIEREIAVRYRIEAVRGRPVKAQRLRGGVRGRSESRCRPAPPRPAGTVHPRARIGKARGRARHLVIGHQVMAQRHRLRGLQMGEAGHDAVGMFARRG